MNNEIVSVMNPLIDNGIRRTSLCQTMWEIKQFHLLGNSMVNRIAEIQSALESIAIRVKKELEKEEQIFKGDYKFNEFLWPNKDLHYEVSSNQITSIFEIIERLDLKSSSGTGIQKIEDLICSFGRYLDNYERGKHNPVKGFELQVIYLLCFIINKECNQLDLPCKNIEES